METLEERVLRALMEGPKTSDTLLAELKTTEPELNEALNTLEAAKHTHLSDGMWSLLPMS